MILILSRKLYKIKTFFFMFLKKYWKKKKNTSCWSKCWTICIQIVLSYWFSKNMYIDLYVKVTIIYCSYQSTCDLEFYLICSSHRNIGLYPNQVLMLMKLQPSNHKTPNGFIFFLYLLCSLYLISNDNHRYHLSSSF